MKIFVPSAGRPRSQVTLRSLKIAGVLKDTAVLVPQRDERSYTNNVTSIYKDVTLAALGPEFDGIAKTRELILTMPVTDDPYRCMLDDDMDFCWRPDVINSPELVTIKDRDRMCAMFSQLEGWLQRGFVHVGVSPRQGNNRPFYDDDGVYGLHPHRDSTRMMNAYAYNVRALRELIDDGKVVLGRVPVMEDFDLTLQLLRAGYPNRVTYEYCWNQRGSGKEGGCSTYRTTEVQAAAAHRLAELHPNFVKVTEKKSESQYGAMAVRTDVTVQWRKAYDSAPVKHAVAA